MRLRILKYNPIVIFLFIFSLLSHSYYLSQKNIPPFNEKQYTNILIQAIGAKIGNELFEADSLFKKCIKLNPNSAVSYFELSGLSKKNGNLNQAVLQAEKAVDLSPDNEWYLANLAILYQEQEEYKKSALVFEKLSKKEPKKIDYLFALTEAYLQDNKYKRSLKILDEIEQEIGLSEDLSLQKHQIYDFLNKKKKAIKELERFIYYEPANLRTIGILAEYYNECKMVKKSESLLHQMMLIDSTNGLVQLSMFQYYMKKRAYTNSIYSLEKVLTSVEVDQSLKREILFQITYDKSIPFSVDQVEGLLDKYLKAFPNDHEILVLLSEIKFIQTKDEEACILLGKALEINPLPYELWTQLITNQLSRGNFEDALKDADKALLIHPNQPFSYLAKGIVLNSKKEWEDALGVLNKGKLLVFDNEIMESEFYQQIGDAHYGLKKIKEAFYNFDKSLEINEKNPILLNNFSYYLAVQNMTLEKAETLILKALQFLPDSYTFIDTYGWVLFKMKKYDEAEQLLFKALVKSEEKDADILEHYGDVLFQIGKKEEALLFWKKAIKAGSTSALIKEKIDEKKYME